MSTLITKAQYKNFEPGEFVDVQERTFEETIKLIEGFPWHSQRENIVIDLTNPSITIEGTNGDYLKLAVFFNKKYVLLYFNKEQRLFAKSFNDLQDGYAYIKRFFEQPVFDSTTFKKETTWWQNNLKHFVTQDFRYELTPKSLRRFFFSAVGLSILVPIIFLSILIGWAKNLLLDMLFPGCFFILFAILPLVLFFNYYNYVKNKILIMSKGNDIFYFGAFGSLVEYNKKEILRCTVIRTNGSRHIYSGFAMVKIEFRNGTMLSIPNLLIDHRALEDKLFQCPKIYSKKFPYL